MFSCDHWGSDYYASISGPIGPELQITEDAHYSFTTERTSYVFVQAFGGDSLSRVTIVRPDGTQVKLIVKIQGGKAAGVGGVGVAQTSKIYQTDTVSSQEGTWKVSFEGGIGQLDVRIYAFSVPI